MHLLTLDVAVLSFRLKRFCAMFCLLMALTAVSYAVEQPRKCIAAPFVSGGVTVNGSFPIFLFKN